jgi:hypothetical protein
MGEWNKVIVWFCIGLFALAEMGNIQMGSEIRQMCALVGDPVASHPKSAAEEIGSICANRVPDDTYLQRLEAQARRD